MQVERTRLTLHRLAGHAAGGSARLPPPASCRMPPSSNFTFSSRERPRPPHWIYPKPSRGNTWETTSIQQLADNVVLSFHPCTASSDAGVDMNIAATQQNLAFFQHPDNFHRPVTCTSGYQATTQLEIFFLPSLYRYHWFWFFLL